MEATIPCLALGDMVGQDVAVRILANQLRTGHVSHSYLFLGPEGVGKETAAYAFARALLCEGESVGACGDACGSCRACRKVLHSNHPDLRIIAPQDRYISIDQVRELQRFLALRPYEARYKVVVLQDADSMQKPTANSLLKTLEEPPPSSVLVLICHRLQGVPDTVLSRCQIIRFRRLTTREITDLLSADDKVDRQRARVAAEMADGSVSTAQRLASSEAFQAREDLLTALRNLPGMQPTELLELSEQWSSREDIAEVTRLIVAWFRDLLIWRLTGGGQLLRFDDWHDDIAAVAKGYSVATLERCLAYAEEAARSVNGSFNVQLALDVLFLRIRREVSGY